jgi:acyl-homoserine lactone acylase PvdQ
MRSQTVADFEAFAEGFNQYAAEHPEEFDDIIFAGLLPLTGPDIFSSNLRVLISFAFAGASGLSGAAKEHFNNIPDPRQAEVEADGKIHTSYMDWDPLDGMVPTELREYIGSNAWAANGASNRTTGNAMLDMNPHLAVRSPLSPPLPQISPSPPTAGLLPPPPPPPAVQLV